MFSLSLQLLLPLLLLSSVITLITLRYVKRTNKKSYRFILVSILYIVSSFSSGFFLGSIIVIGVHDSIPDGYTTEQVAKEYIDTHSNELIDYTDDINFYGSTFNYYKLDTCYMNYWDDIAVRYYDDSAYIIFWGDRESFWWDFRLDKTFMIYNDGDSLDIKLLKKFNEIKFNKEFEEYLSGELDEIELTEEK